VLQVVNHHERENFATLDLLFQLLDSFKMHFNFGQRLRQDFLLLWLFGLMGLLTPTQTRKFII
jgi:hypothetical protein